MALPAREAPEHLHTSESSTMRWRWPTVWHDERGGWWRVPLTLMLYVGGIVLGIALYTQANIIGLKEALKSQPVQIQEIVPPIATILITGLGLLGCLVGIRFLHRKPLACVFTDGRSFTFRLAFQSAALWALLWLGFTIPLPGAWEGLVRRTGELSLAWWPMVIVVILAAMIVGRTAEEVLFRGYLLTRIAWWVKRPWLAVVLVSTCFSIVHRGNPAALTAITLFGLVWGAACIRAGTLAPVVGAHVVHDTLNALLQPADLNANASTTWLEVVLISLALAVWSGWLFWTTRNAPADRITQSGPGEGYPSLPHDRPNMKERTADLPAEPQTRLLFRILAGFIAAFILLVGLPFAVLQSVACGGLEIWLLVFCSLFGGVGLAVGACTGHWPFVFSSRSMRHEPR